MLRNTAYVITVWATRLYLGLLSPILALVCLAPGSAPMSEPVMVPTTSSSQRCHSPQLHRGVASGYNPRDDPAHLRSLL